MHLRATLALTPTLSPEERENLSSVPERSLPGDFFQRGKCGFPLLGERVRVRASLSPTPLAAA